LFSSKKEIEKLKKQIQDQEQILFSMSLELTNLKAELNELKKDKKSAYFG